MHGFIDIPGEDSLKERLTSWEDRQLSVLASSEDLLCMQFRVQVEAWYQTQKVTFLLMTEGRKRENVPRKLTLQVLW